jgi:regulator of sigma E protease
MWIALSLLGFVLLIFVHEFGHFIAARFFKVIVEEFGFGIPPRIRTLFKQGGTIFTLNAIPFGGFVRLKGENSESQRERNAPGSFSRATLFGRSVILLAGVFMNFLFAVVVFAIGFSVLHWVPSYTSVEEMIKASAKGEIHFVPGVMIDEILPDGAAAAAKVPAGSLILKVDDTAVVTPKDVSSLQEGKKKITYTILRTPTTVVEEKITVTLKDGKSGVALRTYPRELSVPSHGLIASLGLSLRETWTVSRQTVIGIGQLLQTIVTDQRIPSDVKGVIGIARIGSETVQEGWVHYLRLLAQLSLSLAIFNVLPFPALDGGRLLFVVAEGIIRRPVNRKFELVTHAVGFGLLLLLILAVTYNDIVDLFWN